MTALSLGDGIHIEQRGLASTLERPVAHGAASLRILVHRRCCCWSARRGICEESLRAQECMSSPAEIRYSGFVIVELQVIGSSGKEKCAAAK
jgi:hypothetical protein